MPTILKRQKYNANKFKVGGVAYDSKAEYERWLELKELEKVGKIKNLIRQVRHPVYLNAIKICTMILDFVYDKRTGDNEWERVLEDYKGYAKKGYPATDLFVLKRRILLAVEGKTILITGPGAKHLSYNREETSHIEQQEEEDVGIKL
jgi:hypothetical protein